MIYGWKERARFPGKAQAVGERLEQLHLKAGALTPSLVVDDARSPKSPLHRHFEWDDTLAAEMHREEQARLLLRSIVVAGGVRAEEYRAFQLIHEVEEGGLYIATDIALSDEGMREELLARAKREFLSWKRRYRDLQELAAIFEAAEQQGVA